MTEKVFALTVYQPWATLIVEGWKRYEIRKWDYRRLRPDLVGKRIAIHASAKPVKRSDVVDLLLRLRQKNSLVNVAAVPLLEQVHLSPRMLPHAVVLGTVVIGVPRRVNQLFGRGVVIAPDSTRLDHHEWAWPLTDIERCVPVPARGQQGFWPWKNADG